MNELVIVLSKYPCCSGLCFLLKESGVRPCPHEVRERAGMVTTGVTTGNHVAVALFEALVGSTEAHLLVLCVRVCVCARAHVRVCMCVRPYTCTRTRVCVCMRMAVRRSPRR